LEDGRSTPNEYHSAWPRVQDGQKQADTQPKPIFRTNFRRRRGRGCRAAHPPCSINGLSTQPTPMPGPPTTTPAAATSRVDRKNLRSSSINRSSHITPTCDDRADHRATTAADTAQ
ncbi:hypothetical protein BD410DRAFT_810816, partial [Rickenella mellea]